MKNSCIKTITIDKGEMTVYMCKMIGKCECRDCNCAKTRRLGKQNEEIKLEA